MHTYLGLRKNSGHYVRQDNIQRVSVPFNDKQIQAYLVIQLE